jgi:stress response protein YsnF
MLVIRKRAVQTNQVVEADLRRERVEVDQRDFRDGEQRPAR